MLFNNLLRRLPKQTPGNFFSTTSVTSNPERLIIFDTTLRDGEQSPGATLTTEEKLKIALQLSAMGVDVCEAGFPIASPGDFEAVSRIAKEVGNKVDGRGSGLPMRICGLSRANDKDIRRCYNAVKHAPLHRIHTFLATSDIHLEHKLKMTRSQCIDKCVEAVSYAKSLLGEGGDIEFSPEDAGRSDKDFLCDVLAAVIEAGATTLNIPDTVGYTVPREYGDMFEYLIKGTKGADDVIWSTHCHNDLGLATANTLEGVRGGARQVEVTVNGIGERAGNTAMEEIAMALKTRPMIYNDVYTDLDVSGITRASRMVSSFTGILVQPNKAIVGANAFAHEAGIHQDGVLKNKETYEIMTPESVGLIANNLVLGKHSGKAAFADRLSALGYDLSPEQIEGLGKIFKYFFMFVLFFFEIQRNDFFF
jgi:2-isopropylmalate synthase